MGFFRTKIGNYQVGRTIGEGTFAKVKLGVDTSSGNSVAIKIIDKNSILQNGLKYQVKREIRTMKLLHHPNIVQIHEVIGTKTKIYIVMEYVAGGQLSDKLSYSKRLNESEARKLFQQLVDAVDHCHNQGVYHRDLKPQNLLLDGKGNLKVSDFGLSAVQKPGGMLSTACGSPCYVAPELIVNKGYGGAAVDVWSCGVILFELLAGYPPFDDHNLVALFKKIIKTDYTFPPWFSESQRNLIWRMLDPDPEKRISIPEIMEDSWFKKCYIPSSGYECDESILMDDVTEAFNTVQEEGTERNMEVSSSFINAFQLIAMSLDLDLSGLFEEQDDNKHRTRLGSENTAQDTMEKIEAAAMDVSLSVERLKNNKMKIHPKETTARCLGSCYNLRAEVIEVTPTNCVVEVLKSAGEPTIYEEFCKRLANVLTGKSEVSTQVEKSEEVIWDRRRMTEFEDHNRAMTYV